MKIKKCTECKNPDNKHTVFCSHASIVDFKDFLLNEMRISMRKQWENERIFKEVTDFYVHNPNLQHLPEVDRKHRAAQSAERKLAASNCVYYMQRATMFAAGLQAINANED